MAKTYRLMTVNTAPERAKRLVGRTTVILNESQDYDIEHVANCEGKTAETKPPTQTPNVPKMGRDETSRD